MLRWTDSCLKNPANSWPERSSWKSCFPTTDSLEPWLYPRHDTDFSSICEYVTQDLWRIFAMRVLTVPAAYAYTTCPRAMYSCKTSGFDSRIVCDLPGIRVLDSRYASWSVLAMWLSHWRVNLACSSKSFDMPLEWPAKFMQLRCLRTSSCYIF